MKTRVIKPVVSEKSYQEASNKKYTFFVDRASSKDQIKDEIERVFKVNILSINTFNTIGKIKKTKGVIGKRSSLKKAIITVDAKSKIDLFEIEDEKKETKSKIEKKQKTDKAEEKESKDVSVSIKKGK